MKELLLGSLKRMLLCDMPDDMRAAITDLLNKPDASEYEIKTACQRYAKRLVLARPREEIHWNPTVDAEKCVGCAVCHDFCPHNVYDMIDGVARVSRPTGCVILCSNCMPKCAAGAISFPEQREYVQLLRYE